MATRKQKQELMAALKFTPKTVRLLIQGYGGECYAGTVDRETYEFFKSKQIDISQYANDWGDLFGYVPDKHRFFEPGSPYDCDGLWHASGAELSSSNEITLDDADGNTIWSCGCEYDDLNDAGVTVGESGGCELADLEDGTVVFWGGQGEKGCFFDAEFVIKEPFDPKKLSISYENCDGWYLMTGAEYDGEELDGSGGYSTTGKWGEHKWIIIGDEEPYEGIERDEDADEDEHEPESVCTSEDDGQEVVPAYEGLHDWDPVAELDKITPPYTVTDWYDSDVKPVHKGQYEVLLDAEWPMSGMAMADWTGRTWKKDGCKIVIKQWRGVTENFD